MNDVQSHDGNLVEQDPTEPVDLGGIAGLFQKWPGPTLMAVGAILAFAATGIRVGGVSFSSRDFVGVEFAAVFLGGIALIALGLVVLLVKGRLRVADEERRLTQSHEIRLEIARAASAAGAYKVEQLDKAGDSGTKGFIEAYERPLSA